MVVPVPAIKFVPVTVSVKSGDPAAMAAEVSAVEVSDAMAGARTVSVLAAVTAETAEALPLCTVTFNAPGAAINPAGTVAVMIVELPVRAVNKVVPR